MTEALFAVVQCEHTSSGCAPRMMGTGTAALFVEEPAQLPATLPKRRAPIPAKETLLEATKLHKVRESPDALAGSGLRSDLASN